MLLKAWSVGFKVLEWLKGLEGSVGLVENVFQSTVNVRLINDELLTVTLKGARSPVNVNVAAPTWSSYIDLRTYVRPGFGVSYRGSTLAISGLGVELRGAQVFKPPSINAGCRKVLVCSLTDVLVWFLKLLEITGKEPFPVLRSAYLKALEALKALWAGVEDSSSTTSKVLRYVGLGGGFTPSYDDFLAGALGLNNVLAGCCSPSRCVRVGRDSLKGRTTWVSSRLIEYSASGLLSELLYRGVESLLACKLEAFKEVLLDSLSVGHTSGADMMLGLLTATSAYLESSGFSGPAERLRLYYRAP